MTDSDRQVYFADFVIELQAVEDDKRRRIRDARRRAEKAQRDDFREALEGLASEGKLTPFSHWRGIERLVESHSSFGPVQEQDREAPREMFEEYIDEWDEIYRRDRSFLSHLVHPSSNREILVTPEMKYDEFVKALMEEAKTSPQLLAETKRLTRADDPTTSASLYFKELVDRAKDKAALLPRRRSHGRRSLQEDSSEDEGEIIEDGEIGEGASTKKEAKQPAVDQKDEGREIQKGDDNVTASNNVVSPSTQRKESASE